MKFHQAHGSRAPAFAALALAFASFGDSFLYAFLPVNSHAVGVPAVWVGVALSINRFVRILSNVFMVGLFAKFGLRHLMIVAVCMAITSTLGYGFASGILSFLAFRICWGLSFSAMRIGTLAYALQQQNQGIALGVSRSLQEMGPMVSLLIAPFLMQYFNSGSIFYVLALMTIPALYFAWNLPLADDRSFPLVSRWVLQWSSLNAITFLSAILIDGILIVSLGVMFLNNDENISLLNATALAALYLGFKRVCSVVFSYAGGWLADNMGMEKTFNISAIFVVIGLFIVISGWIGIGVAIVFVFYSINAAIAPGSASRRQGHYELTAAAENATWRDIGAAIGTLLGGILISSPYLNAVLIMAIFVFACLLLIHAGTIRKAAKLLYLWK